MRAEGQKITQEKRFRIRFEVKRILVVYFYNLTGDQQYLGVSRITIDL